MADHQPTEIEDASHLFTEYLDLRRRYEDYLLYERGLAFHTARGYEWALDFVCAQTGAIPQLIDAEHVRECFRLPGLSTSAKNTILAASRSWHKWLVLEGLAEPNKLMALRSPKVQSHQAPPLSNQDINTLLRLCRTAREHRLLYLGLYAGLRVGESATVNEDSWYDDRLRIIGKGSKLREIPVHPELARVRDVILSAPASKRPEHQRGWNNGHNAMQECRRKMIKRTGVAYFVTHQLRRTFATTLYEADVPFEVVAALLGHAGNVTSLYAPVSWRKEVEAIERLSYRSNVIKISA